MPFHYICLSVHFIPLCLSEKRRRCNKAEGRRNLISPYPTEMLLRIYKTRTHEGFRKHHLREESFDKNQRGKRKARSSSKR
jgi:hypothetical protein